MWHWIWVNILRPFTEIRLSYLPPLMVYMAAGISGLTAIVGTFYVKERLGLSAEFLAALGFWAGLPWAAKMIFGHIVDLIWRWKGILVFVGAGLIAASLSIMVGLLGYTEAMTSVASVETWFVLSALLAPFGYVIQDVVADAMTVEAVPRVDADGQEIGKAERKSMHTTMQTLGRMAIIGGGILVSVVNIYLLRGVDALGESGKLATYLLVYQIALIIPIISVLGVLSASWITWRDIRGLVAQGHSKTSARQALYGYGERPAINWWILGGGLAFTIFSLAIGLSEIPFGQEILFSGAMGIVIFLMLRLLRELEPDARKMLIGTAVIIFVFRAMPGTGDGSSWWMIDQLRFDQEFFAKLSLIGGLLGLLGMLIFRRFMAERSIAYVLGFLVVVGTVLYLPTIGMFYGLHEWTASHTGGMVNARFIAVINTALESPFGQIAMIPMLAWIANSAPEKLKATFFAV
ncbi:MAG: hypothetical protein Q7R54_01450, partial [bacterium]|nr:hypothetical protein [bacterium]